MKLILRIVTITLVVTSVIISNALTTNINGFALSPVTQYWLTVSLPAIATLIALLPSIVPIDALKEKP